MFRVCDVYLLTLFLMQLLLPLGVTVTGEPLASCVNPGVQSQAYYKEGDLIIGGIVPVSLKAVYSEATFRTQPKLLRCETFFVEAYQYILAMVFAIEEINQNPNILPNLTLGFKIFDSCYVDMNAVQGAMWLLSGQQVMVPNYSCQAPTKMAAIIGDNLSTSSVQIARILGLYRFPQVSYASAVSFLSDKLQFPSFLRTVPNNDFQSIGLARLVLHFGWTWIGILATDNDYGLTGGLKLMEEVVRRGGCVDFFETFPIQNPAAKILKIVQVVRESSVKVVIIYVNKPQVIPLLEAFQRENITGRVWVASTSWMVSPVFSQKELWRTLHGSIGFAVHRGEIPGLRSFLSQIHPFKYPGDIFVRSFWENVFGCHWPINMASPEPLNDNRTRGQSAVCTGEELVTALDTTIYDIHNYRVVYSMYNAVYAVAHGLHHLLSCKFEVLRATDRCAELLHFHPWKLLRYIQDVVFTNSGGETLFFDQNGDPPAVFDILNWQLLPDGTSRHIKIGKFDSTLPENRVITINDSAIVWGGGFTQLPRSVCTENCPPGFRRAARLGQPNCCFDCIPCSDGEIANRTDAVECVKCLDHQWSNEDRHQCIPKPLLFLSYQEPLGTALVFICAVFSVITLSILCIFIRCRDTPIIRANNRALSYLLLVSLILCFLCSLIFIGRPRGVTCVLRQVVFAIVFTICVSTVLAKTITVVMAFSATRPGSKLRMWVRPGFPFFLVLLCSLPQVLMCTIWLATSTPYVEYNMNNEVSKITIECNEGSFILFYCALGYLGLLSSVSFVIAFLARRLPSSFNEARMITFSMLVFCSVWLLFIPTYLSTRGKYIVAEEIFAILSSSAGLLCCIFFPKIYIILLRPEMNSKEHLIKKTRADSTSH